MHTRAAAMSWRREDLAGMNTTTKIIGKGEMAKLVCGYDWGMTGLGPIEEWPESLVTSTNLLLQSPVPIVMLWGPDGIMIYNDAYSEFAGARHPKLLGSKVLEGWPEVADFNDHVMETVYRKGKTLAYRDQQLTLYRHNEPEEVWMDLTYSPVIDESGKPGGVLAIVIETTQRMRAQKLQRQAEELLLAERERLRSLFTQAPAAVAILQGADHRFVLANPLYMRLVNNRPLLGKTVREALPEVVEQGFLKILNSVYVTGEAFHGDEIPVDIIDKKGAAHTHYLNFVYQPSYDEQEKVEGILVHAVDVTDQVIARHRVEEIAALNKSITDNATTGLIILDPEQYCTFINPAAEKIIGYTFSEVKKSKKTLHELIHYKKADGSPYPIDECPTTISPPRRGHMPAEDMFIRPDGSMYPVAIMSSPVIRDGKMAGTIIEVRDITKEKAAEQEIRQLNKDLEKRVRERTQELTAANKELGRSNEELQDFAYVASHDLQEPLRKIAAFSNLLEEDYGTLLPEEAHVYLRGLRKSSGRMRTLIDDLLTYSRVTTHSKPFQKVDVGRIAGDALEDLQNRIEETHARVTVDSSAELEADPLQLRLLMQNIISNAMKYSRPGAAPEIHISARCAKNACTIRIRDNGIGFDEKHLDRIFTIFQRLHGKNEYEGTGVGLAIVKKIVDRHNGTITAESKPGEGSTFIITLPARQKVAK